jgi:FkbM family methyltransferase
MPHILVVKLARFTKYQLQALEKRLDSFIPPSAEEIFQQQLHDLEIMPRYVPGQIDIAGWDIAYLDGPALSAMIHYQVVRGINDFQTANPKPYIIDCGANIGISVLRYKQLFPQARILAFEPDPQAYDLLERNIKSNKIDNVKTIQAAVWSAEGTMPFYTEPGQGSHLVEIRSYRKGMPQIDVNTIALVDYLDEEIDLLKIDIEGAELEVLKHSVNELGMVKNLIVEVHYHVDHPTFLSSILEILNQADFNVSMVTPDLAQHLFTLKNPYEQPNTRNADNYPVLYAWRGDSR